MNSTTSTALASNRASALGAQTPVPRVPSPSDPSREYTIPPIRVGLRHLWHPLTARGRATLPLYYLIERRRPIAPAPKAARLGDKLRRLSLVWIECLFWPIARAIACMQVLLSPPDRAVARAWWRHLAAGKGNPSPAPAPTTTAAAAPKAQPTQHPTTPDRPASARARELARLARQTCGEDSAAAPSAQR